MSMTLPFAQYTPDGSLIDDPKTPIEFFTRAVSVEAAGVHYNNTPAKNVKAFNAALARRGWVTLTTPGQYLIGGEGQGGLLIPSDTTLFCGHGVELILADNTNDTLLRNVSAYAEPTHTAVQAVWYGSGPGYACRITKPNIHLVYPVGSWFALLGLPGSAGNNRGYQGVWQVFAVGDNEISFYLQHQPPSGGNSQSTGVIYPVDKNINIIGGILDGNEVGNTGVGFDPGAPATLVSYMRNAVGINASNIHYRQGPAWCWGSNNIRDAIISKITAETFGVGVIGAHDIVHLAGGHRNILIEKVTASCDDNIIGLTTDVLGAPGTYSYPNYDPGDTYNIRIKDIVSKQCVTTLVSIWGNINYLHHDTVIDGVYGSGGGGGVQVFNGFAQTDLLNTNGGSLSIKNVHGAFQTSGVIIRSDGNWDSISIENIRNEFTGSASAIVSVTRLTTTQTIRKLKISNVLWKIPGSTDGRIGPAVDINNSNIDDLTIEDLPDMELRADVSLVRFAGTEGVVKRATISRVRANSIAAGDSFIASCENTGATALGLLTVQNSAMEGTAASGGIVRQAPTGRVTLVRIDNCDVISGQGVVVKDNGVNPTTVNTVTVAVS